MSEDSTKDFSVSAAGPEIARMHNTIKYSGVHGWLAFYVAANLYLSPIMFVCTQIFACIGYIALSDRYPLIILGGAISFAAGLYLVVLGIKCARALRDIKPLAVQKVRSYIIQEYVWIIISIPISFLIGIDPDQLIVQGLVQLVAGSIGFVICILYFRKSKRVRATYPDWQE
jgi:Mn2+/Fe2+ NRAMP family transporter